MKKGPPFGSPQGVDKVDTLRKNEAFIFAVCTFFLRGCAARPEKRVRNRFSAENRSETTAHVAGFG